MNGQQANAGAITRHILVKQFHTLKKMIRFLDVLPRRNWAYVLQLLPYWTQPPFLHGWLSQNLGVWLFYCLPQILRLCHNSSAYREDAWMTHRATLSRSYDPRC